MNQNTSVKRTQPNYLVKNIQNLNEGIKTGKLPCFVGKSNNKGEIILEPYTINSAISNLPISELNQLHLLYSLKKLNLKDQRVITRGEAKAIGTDISNPEKDYIGITRENRNTNEQEVIKFYPVSKVKNIEKVNAYSKKFIETNPNANIPLPQNENLKIDCRSVRDFNEFWGKYKTAATAHCELICTAQSIDVAKKSLSKELNQLIKDNNYHKNYSFGKELENSYQKELRQTFPRTSQRENSRDKHYEQAIKNDGYDR